MSVSRRKKELIKLVKKTISGKATEAEKAFVAKYYEYFDKGNVESPELSPDQRQALEDKMLAEITLKINLDDRDRHIPLFKNKLLRAAAIFVVLVSVSGLFYRRMHLEPAEAVQTAEKLLIHDVMPGGNKAVLTLGNGSSIILDSAGNGVLAMQGGIQVLKMRNGQLVYRLQQPAMTQGNEKNDNDPVLSNTLHTPRGGTYAIELGDGTKVWLNSASSLTFPARFSGNERKVILNGEAYFEVTKDARHPFRVQVKDLMIEDLGTHFNVMAYDDEPAIKTTLLEGALQVSRQGQSRVLSPGQQAVTAPENPKEIHVVRADIEEATAWKNGLFYFHRTDIHDIMRQVSRWYDVDIQFQDSLSVKLNGNIDKKVNASRLFTLLELTGEVSFSIQDKTVIVKRASKK